MSDGIESHRLFKGQKVLHDAILNSWNNRFPVATYIGRRGGGTTIAATIVQYYPGRILYAVPNATMTALDVCHQFGIRKSAAISYEHLFHCPIGRSVDDIYDAVIVDSAFHDKDSEKLFNRLTRIAPCVWMFGDVPKDQTSRWSRHALIPKFPSWKLNERLSKRDCMKQDCGETDYTIEFSCEDSYEA